MQNLGLCEHCRQAVPCEFFVLGADGGRAPVESVCSGPVRAVSGTRTGTTNGDGQIWIRKTCPRCGVTESMVSADARAWQAKRGLWAFVPTAPEVCNLHCDRCGKKHQPNMVFLDVTNRCNMNCPICIATIRGMGFDFNPPMEYFEKIFAELARMNPQPVVQLFGGEPTVRQDLLEIIAIGRKHGLWPHVTTNGIRLADEEYCRKLCEAQVPIRLAFDGRSPDIYEKLRNNRAACGQKLQAFENLKKYSGRKHTIIACVAKGINDRHLADTLQFIHDNRDLVSDLGVIPLTENWEKGQFDAGATTTMEDVEKMVQQAVSGGGVEFVPAGLSYSMKKPRLFFRKNPRSETLLFAGVHPNCESMTFLISDGNTYRGINHYLKKPLSRAVVEFAALSDKIDARLSRLDPARKWQRLRGQWLIVRTFAGWFLGTLDFGALSNGRPIAGPAKAAWKWMFGRSKAKAPGSRRPRRILRVAVLPFEEQHSVDATRMENCKAAFAYEDPSDAKVKYFGACLWYPYRNAILEKLSGKYGVVP